jgi:ATP-dependent DNA ligase
MSEAAAVCCAEKCQPVNALRLTPRPGRPDAKATPFNRPGWIFELKYDSFRVLAGINDKKPYLMSRGHSLVTLNLEWAHFS